MNVARRSSNSGAPVRNAVGDRQPCRSAAMRAVLRRSRGRRRSATSAGLRVAGCVNGATRQSVCLAQDGHAGRPERSRELGFLSRLLVPRSVHRAAHPVRAVRRAATPKVVRKATRATHPLDNAVYGIERSVSTSLRSGRKRKSGARSARSAPVCRHGVVLDPSVNVAGGHW